MLDERGRIMRHIRRGDVTSELQTSRHEVHYHKQKAQQHEQHDAKQTRAWDTSSRAHSEAATGAGATDSAGGNGSSRSLGSIVSFCESALSRTGLVAEFAGEVDSS
jgi:hypothetical protein